MTPPRMRKVTRRLLLAGLLLLLMGAAPGWAAERVPLQVEHASPGAPLTLGLPFPKGALGSPEHVRLLDAQGHEIPAQITEVTSWAPADPESVKWIWVFFFAGKGDRYVLEYGADVHRAPLQGPRLRVANNMRAGGGVTVNTGPLRFHVDQGASGFISTVERDLNGDGAFGEDEVVATGPEGRGSFLDLLDAAGVDSSEAVVRRTWIEKGSGPLHMIIRVEGEYQYNRPDNHAAPFTIRIHAYAGKPYLRVLDTFTYTGEPDRHPPLDGQHALIATQGDSIVDEQRLVGDPRWTQPNDRIAGSGLSLDYQLEGRLRFRTGYRRGTWWKPGARRTYTTDVTAGRELSVRQSGPNPFGMPPEKNSSPTQHIDGFRAQVMADSSEQLAAPRAGGWIDVTGERWGLGVGVRHFFEEYPKELSLNVSDEQVTAYLWPASAAPMSFARYSSEMEEGMVDNFAQGLAKTTELVYHFHRADEAPARIERTLRYFLDPPVAHAAPSWYGKSRVYGRMAARSEDFPEYERGLDYRFDWWLFNQNWEPWYGMFDYGDGKRIYYEGRWFSWDNNEPATDFMWWLEFMRTGNRSYYLAADAASRHAMDVDNVHWPKKPRYVGDDNSALTWWKAKKAKEQHPGSPYVGMGRRHARQQWAAMLSAHVWTPGWIAAYYLTGNHRALDVARETADLFTRRIWGRHGLTGRRLYLSVWNLTSVWDATKDERYRKELEDRVHRMLRLQREQQGGSLIIDRYGYSQVYASHGLGKYWRMTGDPEVKRALVEHARHVRDVPPRNHEMESYLSTIHSLLVGYKLSGDASLYRAAVHRAQVLKTDRLPGEDPFRPSREQQDLAEALESVSHLPGGSGPRPPIWKITNGLRVFGWTHIYNVPWLVYWLEREGPPAGGNGASD